MKTEVKILADSISPKGARLLTYELFFPRIILSEFNTHRVISKNAASSRAIPTNKLLAQLRDDPFVPTSVGKNQPGMQSSESLDSETADSFAKMWKALGITVAAYVEIMHAHSGAHKQHVNRPMETFLPIRVVATTTETANFYELRDSEFAQPEFHELAHMMYVAADQSTPQKLHWGEWHLPYITEEDKDYVDAKYNSEEYSKVLCQLSAARCARVSHAIGGLTAKSIVEEIESGNDLLARKHMSPFEHIAKPWCPLSNALTQVETGVDPSTLLYELAQSLSIPESKTPAWADVRNLRGWRQMRAFVEEGSF